MKAIISGTLRCVAAAALALGAGPATAGEPFYADAQPGTFAHDFAGKLYHASLSEAEATARAAIPTEGEAAVMALGITQFLFAVEGLVSDLHRHGLRQSFVGLPILRLPVPPNPAPDPIDYDTFRTILDDFAARLAVAEATLAAVEGGDYVLPLRPAGILIDLDGDGTYAIHERLDMVLQTVLGLGPPAITFDWQAYQAGVADLADGVRRGDDDALAMMEEAAPAFGFDAADGVWLRGYSNLMSALVQIVLAQDWRTSFDHGFQAFFANAVTPYPMLGDAYTVTGEDRQTDPVLGTETAIIALVTDLAAFAVHSPWTTTEPERMRTARQNLRTMIVTSRQSWAMIADETDSPGGSTPLYREWIPGPDQAQWLDTLPVQTRTVEGWHAFLDTFDKVLDGDLLLPHWRFDQGINVARLLDEAPALSPILILQGSAVLPYLEDGPVADSAYIEPMLQLLDGNLFGYAVWFN